MRTQRLKSTIGQDRRGAGVAHLESIDSEEDSSGLRVTKRIRHVFVMAGAAPRTEWLEGSFILDKKGFIVTGPDLIEYGDFQWPLSRSPLLLETSVPGIFAVGDARAGSIKRVASLVGEGAKWRYISFIDSWLRARSLRNGAIGNDTPSVFFFRLLRRQSGHTVLMSYQAYGVEPTLPCQYR